MAGTIEGETAPGTEDARVTPVAACTMLADLVGVLLPGDATWPSGLSVGVQGPLALRLLEQQGKAAVPRLVSALVASGGPLEGLAEADRVSVVKRLEESEPALFGLVRDAAYVAYYENPFVAEVINSQGHVYELRPHIKGYPVPRFDLARDTPRHGRGHYTPTDQVRRVDTAALDLASNRTQAWGLKR